MTLRGDPRDLLRRVLDNSAAVIAGVGDDQWSAPTPCTEYDVAELTNHLIGAVARTATIAEGIPITEALPTTDEVPDGGWSAAFASAAASALEGWSDDALLAKEITLPWATMPGAGVVTMYAMEAALHTWDLAVATGQDELLDDEAAELLLPIAMEVLPPEHRGGEIPFEPVVEIGEDARASDRLAAYTGRQRL